MLSLKNVTINDKNLGRPILNNVSLEVRPNDFVVVSGQNPLEREALVSVIGALETLSCGEMYVDGIELSKYTPSQLFALRREKFGYMMNDGVIDEHLSTSDNIELPLVFAGIDKEKRTALLDRALNIVGLTNFAKFRTSELSDWQKNKIMIAQAIVSNPSVVIFSEPCRVLDKLKMQEVLGLLSALNRDGVTVVVNSNLEEYASIAKRRIVITDGGILELKKERVAKATETKPRAKRAVKKDKPANKKVEKVKEPAVEVKEEVETKEETTMEAAGVVVEEKPKKQRKKTEKTDNGVNSEQLKLEFSETGDEVVKNESKKGRKQGVKSDAVTK